MSRLSPQEEVQLAARLTQCRQELLAIALLDVATAAELQRISVEVANRRQRIEAVVAGDSRSAGERFEAFCADVARLGEPESINGLLQKSLSLVQSLPLQWDTVERVLQSSRTKSGAGADRASRLPLVFRERVRHLEAEVHTIVARFVHGNQALVAHVVQRYRGLELTHEDLMQEGNLGLLRAVEKLDPGRGGPFSSHATWWIRQAVRRALGRGEAHEALGEGLADRGALGPSEHTAERERADQLKLMLEGLTPREQQILSLRFGLDGADERTLEEIGRSLALPRDRVRHIVAGALGKLHRQTRRRHLEL